MIRIKTGRPQKNISVDRELLPNKKWFTVPEVVELTGIHRHTIQARLRDGTLDGRKISGVWRIYPEAILSMQEDNDE